MTPEQAAKIIQRAWASYVEAEERAKDAFLDEHNKEMWGTYYRECCTPGSWDMGVDPDTVDNEMDDPFDEYVY